MRRILMATAVVCVVYGMWFAIALGLLRPAETTAGHVLFDVLTRFLLPLLGLVILYKFAKVRPSSYWLASPFAMHRVHKVVALSLMSAALLLTYVLFANLISPIEFLPGAGEQRRDLRSSEAFFVIFYLAASAAMSEEIFFRGLPRFIIAELGFRFGGAVYLLVSTVLFGLMHAPFGSYSVLATCYFGFVAALLLIWTNNLCYPLIGHFLSDMLVMMWRYERYGVLPI
jgi:membrane protease YdiL (CAAX protease family)